ncbi:MAG: acetyl-CoA carboxylase biotin carboxyl carrier protein subunit [Desulfobacteraceae bacterium]|nr:acetyl-CoA carboxylase biotin carboxyl carrier protein subunit [Desulfobacteraceae bacterium]MDH3573826.1 acetyl-CoA carboxylase biotin carboxyl carrier protein subunit [Desulfobacteraceae bacterium]MDH3721148.1 acetyl-CoA carboxylase biotin carboxyl carrier protein subunit [Desulfobacteraceae bacterium]MDH3836130.1 acetyl-CoA carboxylase biotin carboxyl carrier protein subunit [Desulfobacteraceae bacterium]MDH3874921.1 acetyl-CoA carboxylase biotin carboxyl carrier protein subunit [Desulfob
MTQEIVAPLDGKVFQLKINPGDKVEEDEEILVIEAMKMETPIFVPCDGVVREVNVKEGEEVAENDVLAIIDEKHIEV